MTQSPPYEQAVMALNEYVKLRQTELNAKTTGLIEAACEEVRTKFVDFELTKAEDHYAVMAIARFLQAEVRLTAGPVSWAPRLELSGRAQKLVIAAYKAELLQIDTLGCVRVGAVNMRLDLKLVDADSRVEIIESQLEKLQEAKAAWQAEEAYRAQTNFEL